MPLASNWRYTGDVYVCGRSGNDINAGTQAAPFKTIGKALTTSGAGNIVVRAGYYAEGDLTLSTGEQIHVVQGDGTVVIDCGSFSSFVSNVVGSANRFTFRGVRLINVIQTFVDNTLDNTIERSIVDSCQITGQRPTNTNSFRVNALYKDSQLTRLRNMRLFRHTFVNTQILELEDSILSNTAFNENSAVSATSNKTNTFTNSAFKATANQFSLQGQGIKNITLSGDDSAIGVAYADGQVFSGVWTDADGNTWNFTNCFWTEDLGFNDEGLGNYTLKTSPQSKLFNNNNIIGKYGLVKIVTPNDEAFNPARSGVAYTNITRNTTDNRFEITAGTEGTVTSTDDVSNSIDLGEERTINDALLLFGSINYFNGEWVDRANFDSVLNNEVRLTLRIQVYSSVNGSWSGWYEQEADQKPELDSAMRGNGNVDFDFNTASEIKGRYFRLELTLRNNGV